jgi:hypothetical protein
MQLPTQIKTSEVMHTLYSFPDDVPEEMKIKIFNLRQWLNELPPNYLITNANIWEWLK